MAKVENVVPGLKNAHFTPYNISLDGGIDSDNMVVSPQCSYVHAMAFEWRRYCTTIRGSRCLISRKGHELQFNLELHLC